LSELFRTFYAALTSKLLDLVSEHFHQIYNFGALGDKDGLITDFELKRSKVNLKVTNRLIIVVNKGRGIDVDGSGLSVKINWHAFCREQSTKS